MHIFFPSIRNPSTIEHTQPTTIHTTCTKWISIRIMLKINTMIKTINIIYSQRITVRLVIPNIQTWTFTFESQSGTIFRNNITFKFVTAKTTIFNLEYLYQFCLCLIFLPYKQFSYQQIIFLKLLKLTSILYLLCFTHSIFNS